MSAIRTSVALLLMPFLPCFAQDAGARANVVERDVARLRAATRAFHTLDSAVAAGYAREVKACLVHEHHGAMGYHHVNRALTDAMVEVERPEILLYERTPDGMRLNGVEYIVPWSAWPRDSAPPVVMGQRMRPESGLRIWYLHVWAWKENPDGIFSDFHPLVACPDSARQVFRPAP